MKLTSIEFYANLSLPTLKQIHADLCEAIKVSQGSDILKIANKIFAIKQAINSRS
jgi:hypothetical protein